MGVEDRFNVQKTLPEFRVFQSIQGQNLQHIGCLKGISASSSASPVQLFPDLDQQGIDFRDLQQTSWAYLARWMLPLAQFGLAAPVLLEWGARLDPMLL